MLSIFLMSVVTVVSPPQWQDVADFIQKLRPGVSEQRRRALSFQISYWAHFYGMDPLLMTALIRQESNFRSGIRACWDAPREEDRQTCDHGLGQINEIWITKWNLDPEKLIHDDSYNIAVVARVLAWIKKYYGSEPDWYGRYHSGTPSRKADYLKKIHGFLGFVSDSQSMSHAAECQDS